MKTTNLPPVPGYTRSETKSKKLCVLMAPTLLETLDNFAEQHELSRNEVINTCVHLVISAPELQKAMLKMAGKA